MGVGAILDELLVYQTIKLVRIKSRKVGLIFRLLQLAILLYIVVYAIVVQKGYQEVDLVKSSLLTKVKGIGRSCVADLDAAGNCPGDNFRIWDPTDYVIPAQENNALFVMTNFVENRAQTQGLHDEDPADKATKGTVHTYKCKADADCVAHYLAESRNGLVSKHCNTTLERCKILGWGPVELEAQDDAAEALDKPYRGRMPMAENYTLFLKNYVFFPNFKRRFDNIGSDPEYIKSCLWDPKTESSCPVFRIGDLLRAAGVEDITGQPFITGAVVVFQLDYTCNLDVNVKVCTPKLQVSRIDSQASSVSPGYNFRYAHYSPASDGEVSRNLYKAYGVRIIFSVTGQAGRFSIVPLLIAFGSGIGLLSLATLVADILVTKVLKQRDYYERHKYEEIGEGLPAAGDRSVNPETADPNTPLLGKP